MVYKFFTKFIVQRIQPLLPQLISEEETSCVYDRHITDNIVVLSEAIHSMRIKTGKIGWMAIKVDLEKVHDRLRWCFIEDTLLLAGFLADLIRIIMDCVSSTSI